MGKSRPCKESQKIAGFGDGCTELKHFGEIWGACKELQKIASFVVGCKELQKQLGKYGVPVRNYKQLLVLGLDVRNYKKILGKLENFQEQKCIQN